MRTSISYATLVLALAAGTSAANAQTTITRQITTLPVETVITQQPVVQTTETVRTVRPVGRARARREVITTQRTVVSQQVAPAVVGQTVVTAPRPLYDVAAPVASGPTIDDTVMTPAPFAGSTIPIYRYVYEPDRILVIDPTTNIAIQALPR